MAVHQRSFQKRLNGARGQRAGLSFLSLLAEEAPCFFLPLASLAFLLGAPRQWDAALAWTLPVWLCVAADYWGPRIKAADAGFVRRSPLWLDARLVLLFVLQLLNIALLLKAVAALNWRTPDEVLDGVANLVAMRVLMGTTSCCSAIAVAHEMIHRRAAAWRAMGRVLLWTVCYDHFAVEHPRGHHRRAATASDPATARRGELFPDFLRRSLRGQWLSAWRLERERLRHRRGLDKWARNRIALGMAAEGLLLIGIGTNFGVPALAMFLYQAAMAVRLLEAVNYFQHWGLQRRERRFGPEDAWETDSWFTLHAFVGLSRHADHHRHAGKPYYLLAPSQDSPRLPYGYFVTAMLLRFNPRLYLRLAEAELNRQGTSSTFVDHSR